MKTEPVESDIAARFNRLEWKKDRMILEDLVFRLEHHRDDSWDLGVECFSFLKVKELVDQYAHFWSTRPSFRAERFFELGIWDGGSIAFWSELLTPAKHAAVDISERSDSPYFARYVSSRNLQDHITTYWRTDQSSRKDIEAIVHKEFDGPLDLVIDDASHFYGLTKASFNILFPHLREGGLYIIEDWAWEHWRGFERFDRYPSLTKLICELVEATGSSKTMIANLSIYEGFAVIEKGSDVLPLQGDFSLDKHIYRSFQGRIETAINTGIIRIGHTARKLLK